jgi:hypothetical protein
MSDTIERDISRLLQASVSEETPPAGIHVGAVVKRAQRIRAQRLAVSAVAVVVAVLVAALVPLAVLRHDASAPPIAPTIDSSMWPTRGDRAHDKALIARARAAWDQALVRAGRGHLTEPAQTLFAGHVPGLFWGDGIVVVQVGPEPHGGQRLVVTTDVGAERTVYADVGFRSDEAIAVVLQGPDNRKQQFDNPCADLNSVRSPMLFIGPPGARSATWRADLHHRAKDCGPDVEGQPQRFALTDGWAAVSVDRAKGASLLVGLRPSALQSPTVASWGWGIQALTGGRAAVGGPVPADVPSSRPGHLPAGITPPPGADVSTVTGGVAVGGSPAGPLGWGMRHDLSNTGGAHGLFDVINQLHPRRQGTTSFSSSSSVMGMALPDGTPVALEVSRLTDGSRRIYLYSEPDPDHAVAFLDRAFDLRALPAQFSAVVPGAGKRHWLTVVGQPGVDRIDYRPAGSTHWQPLDVYLSTAFIEVKRTGSTADRIRLRDTSGAVVYEGPIDAREPVGVGNNHIEDQ